MKKIFILFTSIIPSIAYCQSANWQQEVDYTINVSLNDTENTLDGFVKIKYTNHSPDSLPFIWFQLWPNAFKNDRTAFSEQLLQNGRTDFYFSGKEQRGYINRLDFRVDGVQAKMVDHPLYIDIIKLVLPHPVAPGEQVEITTPFHEKMPYNFSRGGHIGQSYQLSRWYPAPAVYDNRGWHEMPYLDQGGVYNEFGNYEVRITVPLNYIVAAGGELQNEDEKNMLSALSGRLGNSLLTYGPVSRDKASRQENNKQKNPAKPSLRNNKSNPSIEPYIPSDKESKTLIYKQSHINNFAWFADKRFLVDYDTIKLASGKILQVYSFYLPSEKNLWKNSTRFIKQTILYRSALIGEYPYNSICVTDAKLEPAEGMGYPVIVCIPPQKNERELELSIEHLIGQIWFSGIVGSDGRRFPWMTEGINAYYDRRYTSWEDGNGGKQQKPPETSPLNQNTRKSAQWLKNKLATDPDILFMDVQLRENADQPISTSSEDFSLLNYKLIAQTKTALWLKSIEDYLGMAAFDKSMQQYFQIWQGKHPYPEDFRNVLEQTSHKEFSTLFRLLDAKGELSAESPPKKTEACFLFSQKNAEKINYINFGPAAGYNIYDNVMLGAVIHNLNLPPSPLQFVAVPLYATSSRQFNGIGDISYSWFPDRKFGKIELSLVGSRFSDLSGTDSNNNKIFGGFYKIVPAIRFTFKTDPPRSSQEKWIEFKSFFIGERGFNYFLKSTDSNYYPSGQNYTTRYLNQLTFNIDDYRVLYPYQFQLQFQQSSEFYRLNLTTEYFFNYAKGGGLSARFFAAKFGYIGGVSAEKSFETYIYQPKLTATRGDEDYTYSNYFIGRNESSGFASQQIMIKDGGLKIRTDIFQNLQGRSDNWVTAVNFNSSLPPNIIPPILPLKIFLDIGTYANAWGNNPEITGKFLYVSGLQLSLFKNLLNIYAPLFYSSDFANALKSVPGQNSFWEKLSFSLDIQNINLKKIFRTTPF